MIVGGILGVIAVFWYASPTAIAAAVNLVIIGAISGGVVGGICGLIVELAIKITRKAANPDSTKEAD